MNSGIYQIKNLINGKIYLGQTQDFETRKKHHFWKLKGNYHYNEHLQSAFNKYGEENFVFEILIETNENLDEIETKMINAIPIESRYNIAIVGQAPMKNRNHTPESIEKMSGKKHHNYGKISSLEKRKKMSQAKQGEKCYLAKLTESQVREIRFKLLLDGKLTQTKIAAMFGVDQSIISNIKHNKLWTHITLT